jgi:bifunctional DNA-binding transcriptional regulator/antitoxin component of YhaV-PrlF toxin-antitoxin module
MRAGYSGKPLAAKLGLKDGQRVWLENMPDAVRVEIEEYGPTFHVLTSPKPPIEAAHVFVRERAGLKDAIHRLFPLLAPNGFLWISWPKKASKVPTDITEDTIRGLALPLGLVDVKVCAVDAVWSGLKLMIRRENR